MTPERSGPIIGRPIENGDRIATAVRLSKPTHERLVAEANRRCVARNLIIERALVEWLDRAEAQERNLT